MSLAHCVSTLGCPHLSLRQAVDLAARHGIGAIELRALSGSIDVPAKLAEEFGSPEALAAWLEAQSVAVVALGTSARLFGEAFDLSEVERSVPWAEAAGALNLRVFDGGDGLSDADIGVARRRLALWTELRARRGWSVDMMVETHDALVHHEALIRFCREVPQARILWDTHHTWAKGRSDPLDTWSAIASRVVHLHVKESAATPEGRAYVLPGTGDFPMAALRRRLEGEDVAIPVSFEWERLWHPHLPSLDEALSAAAAAGWW